MDKQLVSQENLLTILSQIINDLKTKISNKDISLPYTQQLSKSTYIKVDGNGDMYLSNNGQYVNLGNINKSIKDIYKIIKMFNIVNNVEHWDNTGIKNMSTARYDFGCISYNNKIYCIGGNGTIGYLNTVEIYDITNNTWSTGKPMPTARYGPSCISYNDKIYCLGGFNSSNRYLNNVEIYDITNNTWTTGKPMTTTRYGFGCILYNNKIYCIGGYNDTGYLNNVDIYDMINNTWTTGKPMTTTRYDFGCILYNNKIYCIGGDSSNSALNIVEIYDITNNTWTTGKPMPTARRYFCCILYNNKIYCIGGINGSNSNSNTVEILYMSYQSYSIVLPDIIANKLSKLVSNGLGNKVFRNDGTYKEIAPTVYNVMTSDTINEFLLNL